MDGTERPTPTTFMAMNSVEFDEVSLGSRKKQKAMSVSTSVQGDKGITIRGLVCVAILFAINLLNYMDRYTVAGVLTDIQKYYDINESMAGFLQTIFIIFYMIVAPFCGYLGDRYNRKWIIACGLSIWVGAVLASSFVPSNAFVAFLLLRGLVGVGEASYAIITPSFLADMFTGVTRSRVLMFFYFAIPVGSGLGYVVGSSVASAAGAWQWGVRVTPAFGILSILTLIFVIQEPERGGAEKSAGATEATATTKSGYLDDLKYLLSVRTYLLATLGYTSVVFVTGTLAWWAPSAIEYSFAARNNLNDTSELTKGEKTSISMVFGAITCVAGVVGVSSGVVASQFWRQGKFFCRKFQNDRADALICAIGSLVAVPFLFFGLHLINTQVALGYVLIFITITFLCLNWAINVDMLLYTIIPTRRTTANSWQITISHLFGDASGPYVIGLVSDWVRGSKTDPLSHYHSLLTAFYIPNALLLVSGVAFVFASMTVLRDKKIFEVAMGYRRKSAKVGDVAMFNGRGSGLETSFST